ncbi:MAG: glucosaminidase domain-containing protein, partial [Clostridium sp.]
MRKSTLNTIISIALVIFLLIPNISASAVEINKVLQPLIEEKTQTEVKDTSNVDVGEEVKPEDDNIKAEDEIIKPEGDIVKPSENDKDKIEEESEIKPENEIDAAKDAVKDEANNKSENAVKNTKQKSGEKYEMTQKPQTYSLGNSGLSDNELEREDVKGRLKAISEMEYLVPKTDSNYEIAMAKADGTYIYVDSANTIEEAKSKVENLPMAFSENKDLPAIINADGQVVYSTNAMYKMPATSGNIDLYTDGSLKNTFTYVNSGYVEDAPIIEENAIAYKIEIAGFTGWISKSVASEVVPMNQVTNPSYYMSQGGVLQHFISYDLKSNTNKGYTLTLGPAPSYLRDGVKYFSYDGNYFYDGSNFSTGLNNIISDLRNGNHNKAINTTNPHYLYFDYLPFRSATNYSAAELNNFINANTDTTSKLRGIGQALVDAQNTYGVNAVLTLAVAINESAWGMSSISQAKNNLFGIKAFDSSPGLSADTFKTPGDS